MMDPKQMTQQIVAFNKKIFDNTFHSMTVFQDQAERALHAFLEQSPWFPEGGREAVDEWFKACRKGRDDFKEAMDRGYQRLEGYFPGEDEQPARPGSKKA